jgi:hypothetical protein
MITVRITNHYSDGHHSEHQVTVPAPTGSLEDWWEDEVWPHTGDGHGADDENLGVCYTATIISAGKGDNPQLVGEENEWVSS